MTTAGCGRDGCSVRGPVLVSGGRTVFNAESLEGTSFARRFGSAEAAIAVVLTQGKSKAPSRSGEVSLLLRSSVIAGAGDAILLDFGALAVALGARELAAVVVAASLVKNAL